MGDSQMFHKLALSTVLAVVTSGVAFAQFQLSTGGDSGSSNGPATGTGGFGANPNEQVAGFFRSDEQVYSVESKGGQKYAPKERVAPNPILGPREMYVYKNTFGHWKLPPVAQLTMPMSGSANYRWFDGSTHQDQLTYIAHGYVTDQGGFLLPRGTQVSVWAFMATDHTGNSIFFYFGTDAIINAPQGPRYPMYYSWRPPGPNTQVMRLPSRSGTTRY